MATLTRGQTFGATETLTNTKLHALVDSATISSIVNADIDASAAIADTKLADITTGSKVSGSALHNLASLPSGENVLVRNGGTALTSYPHGGIPYGTASFLLAALSPGTNGQSLLSGGAGANPKFGNTSEVFSTSKNSADASALQTITLTGALASVVPSSVLLLMAKTDAPEASFGMATMNDSLCISNVDNDTATHWRAESGIVLRSQQGTIGNTEYLASLATLGVGTIGIYWTKVGSTSGSLTWGGIAQI